MRVVKNYDDNGKASEKIIFDAEDNLIHSFVDFYDDKGNNSVISRFNNEGEKNRLGMFIYNDLGLLTEQFYYYKK